MNRIPVFKPLIGPEEIAACTASLELGWLGMGSYVGEFEEKIREIIGAPDRHVVAVSTGHAALHLGLMLAGVGPGDEVLTPSFNNIADFQAILAVGAQPVFCDIRQDTLCIDLDQAERLIGPKVKAMIVMDYGSHLADHEHAAAIAKRHNLRVIHDAAHSFGSNYGAKKVGSFSDITMFSFDPVKSITCIDGGALVVRTQEEAAALREMRLIGMGQPSDVMYQNKRAWTYDVRRLGYRYHMANLHAALGLSQLAKLDTITKTRRAACWRYDTLLKDVPEITRTVCNFDNVTPFHYYVRVPAARRADVQKGLAADGVDTGIHWQPGHWFSLFKDCRAGDLSVTDQVGRETLSVPLHSEMDLQLVEDVCRSLKRCVRPDIRQRVAASRNKGAA